jgi:DNA-binding IclR family transcriptional regulator
MSDFAIMIRRARHDPAVSHGCFRALHAIADQCDRFGATTGTLTALAAASGLTAPATSACLDRLGALGYVNVARRGPGYPIRVKLLQRQPARSDVAAPIAVPLPTEA